MTRAGVIGGLEIGSPLDVDEERRLYPVIESGRAAQRALARPVTDSGEKRRLTRARHLGQTAEATLLRATLGLVRARVNERGYRFGNDELEAAGVEGLANAMGRFDPARGVRFSTYANYWIMKLVNQAVQQQAGLTDSEMRVVLAVQKLERSATRALGARTVARELGLPLARATEALQMTRDLAARRYETATLDESHEPRSPERDVDAPAWVIDELRRLCGDDFDDFWQFAFRTTSLELLARERGISRQAMSKRMERCRRAVRESPAAARLEEWFSHQ
ncbi:MAG: sigma-70 family RNA polymerase sigma factor [Acidimicrobiales bacterium]